MVKSGIYTITNLVNGKIYIGMSKNITERKYDHRYILKKGTHENTYLQYSVNKYGIENFFFEVLEYCEEEFLCSQENYWCNMLNTHNRNFGYNIKPTSPHCKCGHTNESRLKLSLAHKGKKLSEEHKKKLSLAKLGRAGTSKGMKLTEEHKEKLRQAKLGRKQTTEQIEKRRLSKILNDSNTTKVLYKFSLEGILLKKYNSKILAINIENTSAQTIKKYERYSTSRYQNCLWCYEEKFLKFYSIEDLNNPEIVVKYFLSNK